MLRWSKSDSALPAWMTRPIRGFHGVECTALKVIDTVFESSPEGEIGIDLAELNFSDVSLCLVPVDDLLKTSQKEDWRLTKERRDEFFRSAEPSYANRRYLDRLGD